MNKHTITWQEVRRMAVELELRLHLAGIAARDRWHALQPRMARLEQALVRSGERASELVDRERSVIAAVLRRLRHAGAARATRQRSGGSSDDRSTPRD
jgi:hypothetical protein